MVTAEVVKVNKLRLVYKGQGEGETRWKGWAWKLLLVNIGIKLLRNRRLNERIRTLNPLFDTIIYN